MKNNNQFNILLIFKDGFIYRVIISVVPFDVGHPSPKSVREKKNASPKILGTQLTSIFCEEKNQHKAETPKFQSKQRATIWVVHFGEFRSCDAVVLVGKIEILILIILVYETISYTLQGTNISPQKWHFEDDFPFPKGGIC